jgi:GTPase SAR1 family protein
MYYRNAQAAVVVYDITKAASLDKAKTWVKELQRQASQNIIICLAANKLDLAEAGAAAEQDGEAEDPHVPRRQVTYEEGKAYAGEQGLLFFETSAKTGQGVQAVFEGIARGIPEETPAQRQPQREERVDLGSGNAEGARAGQCAC